jgi:Exoribonuclease 1 Domain-3
VVVVGIIYLDTIHIQMMMFINIEMVKASQAFPVSDPDQQVREIKSWLKSKGVRDLEPVSLSCDQLSKVRTFCLYSERSLLNTRAIGKGS